jgi:hypothetical protein
MKLKKFTLIKLLTVISIIPFFTQSVFAAERDNNVVIKYEEENLTSAYWSSSQVMMETNNALYLAGLGRQSGASSTRGVLRIDKHSEDMIWVPLQTLTESNRHFAPVLWAENDKPVTLLGGWWGGGSGITNRHNYISYWTSSNNDSIDSFSIEKRIMFDDVSFGGGHNNGVTISYPSINVYEDTSLVIARLPQASDNRAWGLKVAKEYPFEPEDFGPTQIFLNPGDRWFYIQTKTDEFSPNIVHFYLRDHSNKGSGQGELHYFYTNLENGKMYGPSGVIGDINTGEGLPFNITDMWEIYNPQGAAFVESPMTNGEPGADSPVVIPFLDRTEGNHLMVGILDEEAGETDSSFRTVSLGESTNNLILGSVHINDDYKIFFVQDDEIKSVTSDDLFDTWAVETYPETTPGTVAFLEVRNSQDYYLFRHVGTASGSGNWDLKLESLVFDIPEPEEAEKSTDEPEEAEKSTDEPEQAEKLTHSRSKPSRIRYICSNSQASNYNPTLFGRHKESTCIFTSQPAEPVVQAEQTSKSTQRCPLLLTQNLKAPSQNGNYDSYTGTVVTEAHLLQGHLNRLGFNAGAQDGIIGILTDAAIKRMQVSLEVTPDGYVGPVTRKAINASCNTTPILSQQEMVNMSLDLQTQLDALNTL